MLDDFDFAEFWEHSDYATRTYVERPLTDEKLAEIEQRLGYTLPAAYVALMRRQNGGIPKRRCHRTGERTSWAKDHVMIHGIFGIGDKLHWSLCGAGGNPFWHQEWGYPAIGVYFADCPSSGHDMLCLDYRTCGPAGEPRVVHVDQEIDYRITVVAPNFESFIRHLEDSEAFSDD